MGIKNLMKVLNDKSPSAIIPLNIHSLKNKKIAIDTSIILYQFITAVRSNGDNLKDSNGKSTSHIHAILLKTLYYLKLDIIPIHVIDGKPPELKMKILNDRSKIKKDAINQLLTTDFENNNEQKIKLLKKSVSISKSEMKEIIEIIKLLGVPCIEAPEEADSQCAYLSINKLVDYVASEDMDLLTFGTKNIIKNFLKPNMMVITVDDILLESDITMNQFIDLCILLGCDYTDTIEGIGQKKAWNLIKKFGSIENIILKEKGIHNNKFILPENFRYIESREYFTNQRHIKVDETELILQKPKLNELKNLLINIYGYAEDNVEKMIHFLRKKYNIWDKKYEVKKQDNINKQNIDVFEDD